jgi:hypothetical protein
MMAMIVSLRAEIAELQNLRQPISTPSPARKKVCPNAQPSEQLGRTKMQKWIMCPRTHDPSRGDSPPSSSSTGVSVDKWVGDELPPPQRVRFNQGIFCQCKRHSLWSQGWGNERGVRESIGRKYRYYWNSRDEVGYKNGMCYPYVSSECKTPFWQLQTHHGQ